MQTKPRTLNLRQNLEIIVREAMKLAKKPSQGSEMAQEALVQISTDEILKAFKESLPEPIDIRGKYEVEPQSGVHISLSSNAQGYTHDGEQLAFLGHYAEDEGFNSYYYKLVNTIDSLYIPE